MDQEKMWILRFFIPDEKKKIQVFPGRPGLAGKKDVVDITDDLEKYGYLYVSKLELDIKRMYLFNFAKSLNIDFRPDEDTLYPGSVTSIKPDSISEQIGDQRANQHASIQGAGGTGSSALGLIETQMQIQSIIEYKALLFLIDKLKLSFPG